MCNSTYSCHSNCIPYHHLSKLDTSRQRMHSFSVAWSNNTCWPGAFIMYQHWLIHWQSKRIVGLQLIIDLWLLFQMSELSGIAVEDLELCKVKFSKVEQFSLIMCNIIEKKKLFLDHDLLTFVCFFWSVNAGPWTVPLWSLHFRNSWKRFWLGIRHVTTAGNSSSNQWWWCSGLLQVWKIKVKFRKNFSEFILVEIDFSWIQKPHHEFECCT